MFAPPWRCSGHIWLTSARECAGISRFELNGEILAGRPEAWLVKKLFFICMQSKKLNRELMLKFKMISRTCLVFMIAFTVNE